MVMALLPAVLQLFTTHAHTLECVGALWRSRAAPHKSKSPALLFFWWWDLSDLPPQGLCSSSVFSLLPFIPTAGRAWHTSCPQLSHVTQNIISHTLGATLFTLVHGLSFELYNPYVLWSRESYLAEPKQLCNKQMKSSSLRRFRCNLWAPEQFTIVCTSAFT